MSTTWTRTDVFFTVIKYVKYSGVPHFVTAVSTLTTDPIKAVRFDSLKAAQDKAKLYTGPDGTYFAKRVVLTVSYALEETGE
jgi:hypothetical protein